MNSALLQQLSPKRYTIKEDENVSFNRQITAEANIPTANSAMNESSARGIVTYLGGFRVVMFFWMDQGPVSVPLLGFIVVNGFIHFHD